MSLDATNLAGDTSDENRVANSGDASGLPVANGCHVDKAPRPGSADGFRALTDRLRGGVSSPVRPDELTVLPDIAPEQSEPEASVEPDLQPAPHEVHETDAASGQSEPASPMDVEIPALEELVFSPAEPLAQKIPASDEAQSFDEPASAVPEDVEIPTLEELVFSPAEPQAQQAPASDEAQGFDEPASAIPEDVEIPTLEELVFSPAEPLAQQAPASDEAQSFDEPASAVPEDVEIPTHEEPLLSPAEPQASEIRLDDAPQAPDAHVETVSPFATKLPPIQLPDNQTPSPDEQMDVPDELREAVPADQHPPKPEPMVPGPEMTDIFSQVFDQTEHVETTPAMPEAQNPLDTAQTSTPHPVAMDLSAGTQIILPEKASPDAETQPEIKPEPAPKPQKPAVNLTKIDLSTTPEDAAPESEQPQVDDDPLRAAMRLVSQGAAQPEETTFDPSPVEELEPEIPQSPTPAEFTPAEMPATPEMPEPAPATEPHEQTDVAGTGFDQQTAAEVEGFEQAPVDMPAEEAPELAIEQAEVPADEPTEPTPALEPDQVFAAVSDEVIPQTEVSAETEFQSETAPAEVDLPEIPNEPATHTDAGQDFESALDEALPIPEAANLVENQLIEGLEAPVALAPQLQPDQVFEPVSEQIEVQTDAPVDITPQNDLEQVPPADEDETPPQTEILVDTEADPEPDPIADEVPEQQPSEDVAPVEVAEMVAAEQALDPTAEQASSPVEEEDVPEGQPADVSETPAELELDVPADQALEPTPQEIASQTEDQAPEAVEVEVEQTASASSEEPVAETDEPVETAGQADALPDTVESPDQSADMSDAPVDADPQAGLEPEAEETEAETLEAEAETTEQEDDIAALGAQADQETAETIAEQDEATQSVEQEKASPATDGGKNTVATPAIPEAVAESLSPDPKSGVTARMLLDIMSQPASASQPQERALAADTLLRLVARMPIKDLVALSDRVALMEDPPPLLVTRLIQHSDARVAAPLLENGSTITDQDLLDVIDEECHDKLTLIARRRNLTRAVSDALVDHGDPSVFLTVVRNPGASLSREAFNTLGDMAKSHPSLQAPLATRGDTPPPVAFELFWILPTELRRYVLSRFLTDSVTLDKILKIALAVDGEAAKGTDEGAVANSFPPKRKLVELVELVVEGVNQKAAALLAELAGLSEENASRIIADPDGEPLAVAFKAMGASRSAFAELMEKIRQSKATMLRQDRDISELQNIFDSLSFNKARTLLTYWDWAIAKTGPYAAAKS